MIVSPILLLQRTPDGIPYNDKTGIFGFKDFQSIQNICKNFFGDCVIPVKDCLRKRVSIIQKNTKIGQVKKIQTEEEMWRDILEDAARQLNEQRIARGERPIERIDNIWTVMENIPTVVENIQDETLPEEETLADRILPPGTDVDEIIIERQMPAIPGPTVTGTIEDDTLYNVTERTRTFRYRGNGDWGAPFPIRTDN